MTDRERYSILSDGQVLYTNLTEDEYFDTMDILSEQFYKTGCPSPDSIETKITLIED
jgi:hypothetical protein